MRETRTPTRKLLGGIASEVSFHALEGADDAVLRALNVALSLSLLVLNVALGLTLLARRLERLKARHVANRLLHLSDSVLDVSRQLAIDGRNVRFGVATDWGGRGQVRTSDRKT